MVIILVALPRRYYHVKIYNNSSVELSRNGLGESVRVGMECHKPTLYPYQNIVCKKSDSGIDHCSTVWIMRFNTQQQEK